MKKISLFLATTAIIIGMMSCDKLKAPYIIEPIVEDSDTIPLTPDDINNFDGRLVVLLEDYTGVKCNNCPAAAEIANQLQEQNEGHLIVLGVHPKTPLQNPAGGFPDFRTDDGHEWNTEFNISTYPSGLVNRTGGVLDASRWTTAVNNLIGQDAPIRLIVKTEYGHNGQELKVSVHTKFLETVYSGDVRLTVCMMEDSIVGKQMTPDGVVDDYMHRHVFRGTANGQTWGSILDINADYMEEGREFISNMRFILSDEYNADQFYIVAFISDNTTNNILMATETKIK